MAALVLVTVATRVLFTRECFRRGSGHMDKPVLFVRVNLHKVHDEIFFRLGSEVVR